MCLGKYLSSLITPELEDVEKKCNFTEDESIVFHMLSKNKGITEVSLYTGMSESSVSRRISSIKKKLSKLNP